MTKSDLNDQYRILSRKIYNMLFKFLLAFFSLTLKSVTLKPHLVPHGKLLLSPRGIRSVSRELWDFLMKMILILFFITSINNYYGLPREVEWLQIF